MSNVTIGGERLGSGKKMKAYMHNYERSTHDLSYVWRSTMAAGTLVPFMTEVALPGDTFDIQLRAECLTHPTIGPLFGTYKIQLDVFQVPVRLYQQKLHMNMLNIGRDMSKVWLPHLRLEHVGIRPELSADNQQINPSCIFSYLGIRGLGQDNIDPAAPVSRNFNAIPYLGYWDIYKNYYANKQEEIGAVIHKTLTQATVVITAAEIHSLGDSYTVPIIPPPDFTNLIPNFPANVLIITATGLTNTFDPSTIKVTTQTGLGSTVTNRLTDIFGVVNVYPASNAIIATNADQSVGLWVAYGLVELDATITPPNELSEPQIVTFPLEDIDKMRTDLLKLAPDGGFEISQGTPYFPYMLPFQFAVQPDTTTLHAKQYSQEGLALKTYNSDLFNNWISTEWIDGADGISEITKIDTSSGSFTIDELNLNQKIYNMLNRIAISGGTYDDWLDAVYTHERTRSAENPMYLGGLIKELVFQEVISNSRSLDQPLGTLAGRGTMGGKHKGGNIIAKIDEPSYLIGIVSLTPNVDYSQGNKWDTNLDTMNDFHKPALDAIGFQDLITDQMAWWDTRTDKTDPLYPITLFQSAGKQPAWINYMTNVNVTRGNFAEQTQQMFMTLNRRYTPEVDATGGLGIGDITTYIDPSKYNHIFAETSRDAQNFWMQIGVDITARRKMSAKIIPNL